MNAFLDVVVPIRTTSKTNDRDPWPVRAKKTKAERDATALVVLTVAGNRRMRLEARVHKKAMRYSFAEAPLPCTVTLTRQSPRALDDDNVRGALKAVRDEVAAFLGVDDRDPRVRWEYAQEKTTAGTYGVRVLIEEVQP